MFSRISQLSKIIESSDKIGPSSNEKSLWNNEINKKFPFDLLPVAVSIILIIRKTVCKGRKSMLSIVMVILIT